MLVMEGLNAGVLTDGTEPEMCGSSSCLWVADVGGDQLEPERELGQAGGDSQD